MLVTMLIVKCLKKYNNARFHFYLEALLSLMRKSMVEGLISWECIECGYVSKYKTRVEEHVEARHVALGGLHCQLCHLFCPNKKSLRNHQYKYHSANRGSRLSLSSAAALL